MSSDWERTGTKWRLFFIAQVGATVFALYFCFTNFFGQQLRLHVEDKLLDGRYPVVQVPDYEIKEFAYDFVALNANYNPFNAENNFKEGRKYLIGPALEKYDREVLNQELRAIRDSDRSQVMEINPARTKIVRDEPGSVTIMIEGQRSKIVKRSTLPPAALRYRLKVEVTEGEAKNRLGLMISDYSIEVIEGR